jgi:hypothetical protein
MLSSPCYELWFPSINEQVDTGDCVPHFDTLESATAAATERYSCADLGTPTPRLLDHPCVEISCKECGDDPDDEVCHYPNQEHADEAAEFAEWRRVDDGWLCCFCAARKDHNVPDFTPDFIAGVVPAELDPSGWEVDPKERRAIFTVRGPAPDERLIVSVEERGSLFTSNVGRYEICVADHPDPKDKLRRSCLARTPYPFVALADLNTQLVQMVMQARIAYVSAGA